MSDYDNRNTEVWWGKSSNPRGPDARREVYYFDGSKKVTAYWNRKDDDNPSGPIRKAKTEYFNADGEKVDWLPAIHSPPTTTPAPSATPTASNEPNDDVPF